MSNTLDYIYIPRKRWGDGGVGNHNNIKDVVASEGMVWVWYDTYDLIKYYFSCNLILTLDYIMYWLSLCVQQK